MSQWFKNGWEHPGTTGAGFVLSVLVVVQGDLHVNSFWLSAAIFVLGYVSKHP